MVQGIETFKEFNEQYVIIGGTACAIYAAEQGENFWATRDIDLVLIIEALTPEFVKSFWNFIQKAGYEHINNGRTSWYVLPNIV